MTSWAVATHLLTAVKNGPTTMWGSSRHPGPFAAFGRLITSWPWLLGITCAYLALVGVVYTCARSARGTWGKTATALTAALGLTVIVELLTRSSAIGWIVMLGLIAACINAVLRFTAPPRRRPGRTAEVIDLQRWREGTPERHRSGRR